MLDSERVGGHHVEFTVNGRGYWGYTSIPAPQDLCCFDGLRNRPEEQLVTSVAIHEAGHAVAAFYAQIPVASVEITALPACVRCQAPQVSGRNQGLHLGVGTADDTLRMLAAGVEAELLWAEGQGSVSDAERWAIEVGGIDDQGTARDVVDSLQSKGWPELDYRPPGPVPRSWNWPHQRERARSAARCWWGQIEAVANQLVHCRRLDPAEITTVLNSS
ncbi:hypothetical protein ACFY8Z_35915 [Streptomyces microflavus]|uniref:hypothetical protein n=1 Tax=Streptomyces microflavus TaxID=1919 RepID=UPI0036E1FD14